MKMVGQKEPVSESDINKLENTLGLKLPPIYRNFLLKYNGGEPIPDGLQVGRFD
ncbi:MAG: SMI1/KNR4 family protein, partial [Ferruginibacter sp.]|nr:SMI1/KNR4 family protein [Cytophagales bacterium]